MKKEITSKTEILAFCMLAVCSGLMIGIGGTASLLARHYYADWGRLIGAVLFSLGIYAIVAFEMKLFTGMVADIPTMPAKNLWTLPVCFLGNIVGVGLIAIVVYFSPVESDVTHHAIDIISGKLASENWAIGSLTSSILCGMLITLSVWSVKYAPKKGLSSTVGVMFPIIFFAFCGFDHSVANMLYFYYLGRFDWQIVAYILLSILGNIIGGVILPLIALLKQKSLERTQAKRAAAEQAESEQASK